MDARRRRVRRHGLPAPKPPAPWWLVESIERGHIVSWTDSVGGETHTVGWWATADLASWRARWDQYADPTMWRVTDVHAPGGPKLIAGR